MDVDPCYKFIEIFRGGVHWNMMESKDFTSNIIVRLKNENAKSVSFNRQTITFRLSNKEV